MSPKNKHILYMLQKIKRLRYLFRHYIAYLRMQKAKGSVLTRQFIRKLDIVACEALRNAGQQGTAYAQALAGGVPHYEAEVLRRGLPGHLKGIDSLALMYAREFVIKNGCPEPDMRSEIQHHYGSIFLQDMEFYLRYTLIQYAQHGQAKTPPLLENTQLPELSALQNQI